MSRKKKIISAVVAAAAVAGTSGVVIFAQNRGGQEIKAVSVMETKAETGNISKTIVGTGNLETEDAVDITVPQGVEIEDVLVESGDLVLAGDVLATVDEASVLGALEDVQEEILSLDQEINELKDEEEDNVITTNVAGRVKRIYIAEGDSTAQCMLENGALILLSIDGKLGVSLEDAGTVAEGESVTVVRSDGSEKTGTVESISGNTCTVTLSDSGVGMDETVTIYDEEGNLLGSGVTYIHQELAITGTGQSVEEIHVSEDESVSAGETLLTLTGSASSAKYEEAMAKRTAFAKTLQKLLQLSQDSNIKAEMDGMIQSVNVSSVSDTTSENTAEKAAGTTSGGNPLKTANMSYTGSLINLAAGSSSAEYNIVSVTADNAEEKITLEIVSQGSCTGKQFVLAVPFAGEVPVTSAAAEDGSYTAVMSYEPSDEEFQEGAVYKAEVVLSAGEGFYFGEDSITKAEAGVVTDIKVSEDGSRLAFTVTFPEASGNGNTDDDNENTGNGTEGDGNQSDNSQSGGDGGSSTGDGGQTGAGGESGTGNGNQTGTGGENGTGNGNQTGPGGVGSTGNDNQSGAGGISGIGNGNQTGNGSGNITGSSLSAGSQSGDGNSSSGSDSSDTAAQYSTDVTAFTISSNEKMKLSVNVDELDINSVSNGQTAVVTFDALENQQFEGQVTKVSSSASASGGVAKYSVSVTIDKTEEMKAGMNASATITVENRENIVTIPVEAVQERGNKSFVYTEKTEDGTLGGEKEITTGLSDGSIVEITEGLSEGDIIYYQRTGGSSSDTPNQMDFGDFSDFSQFGDFEGMGEGMPGGQNGKMPDMSGGNIPSPPSGK